MEGVADADGILVDPGAAEIVAEIVVGPADIELGTDKNTAVSVEAETDSGVGFGNADGSDLSIGSGAALGKFVAGFGSVVGAEAGAAVTELNFGSEAVGESERLVDGVDVEKFGLILEAGVGALVLAKSHFGADAEFFVVEEKKIAADGAEEAGHFRSFVEIAVTESVDQAGGRGRGGATGEIAAKALGASDTGKNEKRKEHGGESAKGARQDEESSFLIIAQGSQRVPENPAAEAGPPRRGRAKPEGASLTVCNGSFGEAWGLTRDARGWFQGNVGERMDGTASNGCWKSAAEMR